MIPSRGGVRVLRVLRRNVLKTQMYHLKHICGGGEYFGTLATCEGPARGGEWAQMHFRLLGLGLRVGAWRSSTTCHDERARNQPRQLARGKGRLGPPGRDPADPARNLNVSCLSALCSAQALKQGRSQRSHTGPPVRVCPSLPGCPSLSQPGPQTTGSQRPSLAPVIWAAAGVLGYDGPPPRDFPYL